jgi:hypothetical protein
VDGARQARRACTTNCAKPRTPHLRAQITRGRRPYSRYRTLIEQHKATGRLPSHDDDATHDAVPLPLPSPPPAAAPRPAPEPRQRSSWGSVWEPDDDDEPTRPPALPARTPKLTLHQRLGALRCGGRKLSTILS